jgi:hypothetical protein
MIYKLSMQLTISSHTWFKSLINLFPAFHENTLFTAENMSKNDLY